MPTIGGGDDFVWIGGPDEGLWLLVVVGDEAAARAVAGRVDGSLEGVLPRWFPRVTTSKRGETGSCLKRSCASVRKQSVDRQSFLD
jgi:hypothetical protein